MFELAGLGVGLVGAIGKLFARGRANRDLDALQKQDPNYVSNPIAGQRLSLAQTLLNARMPGAAAAERNIYANQGNQLGNINRNAGSGEQALALGAATLGQSNQAFNQLGQQEAADYQRRYGNLQGAQEGMINEGDKVYQDQIRRFGDTAQIRGAQAANRAANWGDVANAGFGLMDFGAAGGFKNIGKLFGGGGGGNPFGGGAGGMGGGNPFSGGGNYGASYGSP